MRPVVDFCEHVTEPSGLTDGSNFLSSWETTSFSRRTLLQKLAIYSEKRSWCLSLATVAHTTGEKLVHIRAVRKTAVCIHKHFPLSDSVHTVPYNSPTLTPCVTWRGTQNFPQKCFWMSRHVSCKYYIWHVMLILTQFDKTVSCWCNHLVEWNASPC